MIGEVVGGYKISAKIGEGGMGVVYLAKHAIMGRKAVVKVLRSQLSTNREMVQRFFNEARAAGAISHPGIVSVFDMGQREDGSAYIVMDFLEGESLAQRLRRSGRLDSNDAISITRQILSALSAAHDRGIVHRDLKPDNIFIVRDPELPTGERIKLLDFGIAKLQGDVGPGVLTTQAGALMGTPAYMSPEQCRGAGKIDQRADLYAVGVMLFELLTGSPPFKGAAFGDLMAAHMRDAPPKLRDRVSGIPGDLEEIVAKLLAKSPADRYQSGNSAIERLDTLTGGRFASAVRRADSTPIPPNLSMDPLAATVLDSAEPPESKGTTMRDSAGSIDVVADPRRRGWRGPLLGMSLTLAGLAAVAAVMVQTSNGSDAVVVDVPVVASDAALAEASLADAAISVTTSMPTPRADALPPLSFDVVDSELTLEARRLTRRAERFVQEARAADTAVDVKEKVNDAMSLYVRAIEKDPGHIMSRYNFAALLNEEGEVDDAVAILKQFKEAACPQCLGRLIRAKNDVSWKRSWDDPRFLEITQRVHLEQPTAEESGIVIASAIRDNNLDAASKLLAPRGTITVRLTPVGCKKRSCRETVSLIGPEALRAWLASQEQSVAVGEQRCHRDCCEYETDAEAKLQLEEACTDIDSGAVRSVTRLEFMTLDESYKLED